MLCSHNNSKAHRFTLCVIWLQVLKGLLCRRWSG
jgi:hypothetical protein